MSLQEFPAFIRSFNEADINWPGLSGWLVTGAHGQVVFFECDRITEVGQHSHGWQLEIVLAGEVELDMEGSKKKYRKGEAFVIPAGAAHGAKVSAGYRAIAVFEENDRYRERKK